MAAGAIDPGSKSSKSDSDGESRIRERKRVAESAEKPVAKQWAMWLPLLVLAVAWLVSYAVYGSVVSSDVLGTQ